LTTLIAGPLEDPGRLGLSSSGLRFRTARPSAMSCSAGDRRLHSCGGRTGRPPGRIP